MSYPNQIFAVVLSLFFLAGSAQAQVELISRTDPSLISDTGGGLVTTSISADGRYIVFNGGAGNLIPGLQDTHPMGASQVFLRDRQTGVTTLVSRTPASPLTMGNHSSNNGLISADGRFVVFESWASNLVAGQNDSLNTADIFLYDRVTGATTLVSHASGSPTVTASDHSTDPVISADGRYVAFSSWALDLLPTYSNEAGLDVFLFDRVSGTISLVSHGTANPNLQSGGSAPAISADGAYVAFLSGANLTGDPNPGDFNVRYLFLYETATGAVSLVSRKSDEPTRRQKVSDIRAALSAEGRFIAFTSPALHLVPGQTEGEENATDDVFVFDRVTGTMALASRSHGSAVTPGDHSSEAPTLSADGRYVAFLSGATNLVAGQIDTPGTGDVFLHDLVLGTTILVSRSSGNAQTAAKSPSFSCQISADGSHVAFMSQGTDLVPGQVPGFLDVFLFDRTTGTQRWVSRPLGAAQSAERWSLSPLVSSDGGYVAYRSANSDLVSGVHDPLQDYDVFLYSRATEENSIISRRDPGSPALSASGDSPLVSGDGRFVAYRSNSRLLLSGTGNQPTPGLYLYDRLSESMIFVSHETYLQFMVPLGISDDGRFVTFQSMSSDVIPGQVDSSLSTDVFSYDRIEGSIRLVSRTAASPVTTGMDRGADGGRPSRDGRYIPFRSSAENLVSGQIDTGTMGQVFLHDRTTGLNELVSHASGAPAREANGSSGSPAISRDGRYVAFASTATDLVSGVIDTDHTQDLFLHDRGTGVTTLVSRSGAMANKTATGESWGPVFAGGGRCLVFTSLATDLVPGSTDTNGRSDVFLYSLVTGNVTLVSRAHGSTTTGGNGDSFSPSTGDDCSAIAFTSHASNLLPGQAPDQTADLFLSEPVLGVTTLLGTSPVTPAMPNVLPPVTAMSADSRFAAFATRDDLIGGGADHPDENVYLFDRASRDFVLVSRADGSPTTAGNFQSGAPGFSADSRFVAFHSTASNLVAGDFNAMRDGFLFDTQSAGSDFYTLASPCRLVDTRSPEDGPALISGTPAVFELDGGCGIPATARALALNVTVFNPTGQGNLSLSPGDAAPSGTSTINFLPGVNKANNAIVRLSLDGSGSIGVRPLVTGGGTVHVILDVVGYFE